MSLAGLRHTLPLGNGTGPRETKSGSDIYSGSPNGLFELEFRTKVRVALYKQKSAKNSHESRSHSSATSERPRRSRLLRPQTRRHQRRRSRTWKHSGGRERRHQLRAQPGWMTQRRRTSPFSRTRCWKVCEAMRTYHTYLAAQDLGLEKLLTPTGIDDLVDRIRAKVFPLRQQEARELFGVGQLPRGPLSRQGTESMTSYISRRRRWWRKLLEMDDGVALSDPMRGVLLLRRSWT